MAFPTLDDPHAAAVLALTAVALVLFTRERIPLESSSLLVLVVLCAGFEIFPYRHDGEEFQAVDFFYGFGHEALVAVCALMMAGQGLVRTGALEPIGRSLARLWGLSPQPMGLATLIGGMATTIGTSTNLLVVTVAEDLGMRRLEMFDFTLPAAVAGGVGLIYLWLVAPRLLPEREALMRDASPRIFTARLVIPEDSDMVGKTLSEATKKTQGQMKVRGIERGGDIQVAPLPDVVLRAGDRLLVNDTPQQLKEFEGALGGTLYSGGDPVDEDHPLTAEDQQIAELAITQGSSMDGVSLRYARFIERYQLVVLALHRAGRMVSRPGRDVADVALQTGDILLVQGAREQIAALKQDHTLLVLDATLDLPHTAKAPLALLIMAAIVASTALGVLPIAVSALAGALLMVLTGCMSWRDAGNALSAQVILIVATSLALGKALLITGGTEYMTGVFLALTADATPTVVLSSLMLLLAVLTNIVSNNAAAVIGTPIALGIARELGLPPEVFVLAVLFGANMSYATPMAYKTNLLVMTAGGYRFSDFVRVGLPLTLLMWLTLTWVLPLLYGV